MEEFLSATTPQCVFEGCVIALFDVAEIKANLEAEVNGT
jgi:hypothetical protein